MTKRLWIPVVLIIVLAVTGLIVVRLHGIFASRDLNANAAAAMEIQPFNPKVLIYEVFGPPGSTASINYWDADANTHQINGAPLPWSYTISTTLPSMTASLMAQGDEEHISCRVTVNGVIRDERHFDGFDAQTFCLVKSI